MSSDCCSFDLGCLSKPLPAEAEAHQVCEWLLSCTIEQAHHFCRLNAHHLASLVVSTGHDAVRHVCLGYGIMESAALHHYHCINEDYFPPPGA